MNNLEDEKTPFGFSQINSDSQNEESYDACASGDTCSAAGDSGGKGGSDDDD